MNLKECTKSELRYALQGFLNTVAKNEYNYEVVVEDEYCDKPGIRISTRYRETPWISVGIYDFYPNFLVSEDDGEYIYTLDEVTDLIWNVIERDYR